MDAPQRKQIPKPDDYKPDEKFAVGHRYEGRARCSGWNGTAGRQLPRQDRWQDAPGRDADKRVELRSVGELAHGAKV